MSFRTIVITERCKLDLRMNYMEVRKSDGKKRVFLDEIDVLILENPAVSMTGCLLSELMKKKVAVIFCDAKHNPQGEFLPYGGSHDSSRKIRPPHGLVQILSVTEKQFSQMEFITGEYKSDVVDSDERLVIL